jgi:hypothetical protein
VSGGWSLVRLVAGIPRLQVEEGARVRCVVIAWCDRDTACGKRGPDHRREVTRLGKRLDTRSPLFWSVLPIVEWIELF